MNENDNTALADAREHSHREMQIAAEEVHAANVLLHTLLDTMPVGVIVCEADGAVLMTNPPGKRILGSTVYGNIEHPKRTYTPHYPDGRPFPSEEMPLVRALREGERVEDVEILIRRENGSEHTILAGAAPVRDSSGKIISGVTTFQDITERKKLEIAVEEERNLLRTVMENTHAHLVYLDPDFNFIMVNQTYAEACDRSPKDLIGSNYFDLFSHAENQAIFERVRDTGEPVAFYARPFEFPDQPELGVTYWDWTLMPVENDDGEVKGLVLSLLEVTEQVNTQAEIEILSRFPSENPNPVLRIAGDGRIQYANAGSSDVLAHWQVDVGQSVPDKWQRLIATTLKTGVKRTVEMPCDGQILSLTIAPLPARGYANIYGLDITDLKTIQQAFRGLHEVDQTILSAQSIEEIADVALRYTAQLFNCLCSSITLVDLETRRMKFLAKYSGGDVMMLDDEDIVIDDVWGQALDTMARGEVYLAEDVQHMPPTSDWWSVLQQEGVSNLIALPLIVEGNLVGSLNLGMHQPSELTANQMEIARELASQVAVGIRQARLYKQVQRHTDELEERVRRRTRALRASEARFRATFQGAGIGIAILDKGGQIIESNPALEELLGYTSEGLRGRTFSDFLHPDDVTAETDFHNLLMTQQGDVRRDQTERRFLRRDGGIGWARMTVSLVERDRSIPRFVIVMMEDITERRQAQEALLQSEKLAVTGRLAASLGHEINNPLQAVIGCLELAEEASTRGQDPAEFLQLATSELERAARIVTQLRGLNQPSKADEKVPTDVTALIHHVLMLTKNQCTKRSVDVEWESVDNLPHLILAPDRIHQVFLNLVLNAVEAMPDGGRLDVRASVTEAPPGIRVSFTDTGGGITTEEISHLFEPFYTTKPDGLGLGLYVTHNIVAEHGGHIEVESSLGAGATFTVWLPA